MQAKKKTTRNQINKLNFLFCSLRSISIISFAEKLLFFLLLHQKSTEIKKKERRRKSIKIICISQ